MFDTARDTYTPQGIEGEGATSVVYRVTDSEGARWALKCLKPSEANTSRVKRFLNEFDFCSRLSHANVVDVIDHGFRLEDETKCPFYVMRLFPSTLRKQMRGGLSGQLVMRHFSEILNGVEAAHLQGVWHRDLKPENILYDPDGQKLVVSDFGIAHFTVDMMSAPVETVPGERLANFQYAAPEQKIRGAVVDHRADIYSLGLILNEMFTAHVPQGVGFQTIGQVSPGFAYLDEVVERMVQHSAGNRPGSIDEIKRILIARENDFISRQKLDTLRRTVVPSITVDDPLVDDPPRVVDIDIRGSVLSVILSQVISGEWIRIFRTPRNIAFMQGADPSRWQFDRDTASVRLPRDMIERYVQTIVDHFKDYVQKTNAAYREFREASARQQEENEKRRLQETIAEEERRQKIRKSVSI